MWGFFQRLFYGRSGTPPSEPVNTNRVVRLIDSRILRIMKSDRIEQIKRIERITKASENRVSALNKSDRVTVVIDQRIIKVKS